MKTMLTGLKPTGELTLGNYIGAIKPMVNVQYDYDEVFLFVADLHALTVYQDSEELRSRIKRFIAMYIACGIDPNKVTIYIQSENYYIPAISWLLECNTYYGEASRMIQFKEKSKENENFTVGLLTYPVLMAADILYCNSTSVPVGIDQKQHVEIARDIAERFNKRYGETFVLPDVLLNENTIKIKDLKNPLKKMSKSESNPNGVISLFDDFKLARKKIMGATTDSEMMIKYDLENKPGISNLINMVVGLTDKSTKEIEEQFKNKTYGEFKTFVADVVEEKLEEIQKRYEEILNSNEIEKILDQGRDKSILLAKQKYEIMCQKIGLTRG